MLLVYRNLFGNFQILGTRGKQDMHLIYDTNGLETYAFLSK